MVETLACREHQCNSQRQGISATLSFKGSSPRQYNARDVSCHLFYATPPGIWGISLGEQEVSVRTYTYRIFVDDQLMYYRKELLNRR